MPAEKFFNDVIKELEAKISQLDNGIRMGQTPTRKELESFIWKTGRVLRHLIKPEDSEARKIFWSEAKGILKKVLIIEKFNPGVFTNACVREDVIEGDLLSTLQKMLIYTKRRSEGKVEAPKKALDTDPPPPKKPKTEEEEKTEEKEKSSNDWSQGWGDKKWNNKNKFHDPVAAWKDMPDFHKKWDEEESDPDEPCPDKLKHGSCSYGRQCCFCN